MISNPTIDLQQLNFAEYVQRTQEMLLKQRIDLNIPPAEYAKIIDANSPKEFCPISPIPGTKRPYRYGVLLIHGLLDSPLSVADIGKKLAEQGILCRSVLLPGHGTTPSQLLNVTYKDWISTTQYGIDSFKNDVDHLFLLGYSSGAALSAYHSLKSNTIAGIIMISPAIRLKAPVGLVVGWHKFLRLFRRHKSDWIYSQKELDYAKYQSIPFNAFKQITKLIKELIGLGRKHKLDCPILMVMTKEDETISSKTAIEFFSFLTNPRSRMLLYSGKEVKVKDERIIVRPSRDLKNSILNLSHMALPFAPDNLHYGRDGDYPFARRPDDNALYGAYNRIEVKISKILQRLHILRKARKTLTYNPDFEFMVQAILDFIFAASSNDQTT